MSDPPADLFGPAEPARTERMVEALLFASAEPLTAAQIAARLPAQADVEGAIDALRRHYQGRGVRLERAGDGWAFRTAPDLAGLFAETAAPLRKLSRAAMETLAIIAYHQPVTRAEIEEIRGVATARGTLDTLLELGWIRIGPRRESPGRPVTLVTTRSFLDHFGLESAADLPRLAELREAGLTGPEPLLEPGVPEDGPDGP